MCYLLHNNLPKSDIKINLALSYALWLRSPNYGLQTIFGPRISFNWPLDNKKSKNMCIISHRTIVLEINRNRLPRYSIFYSNFFFLMDRCYMFCTITNFFFFCFIFMTLTKSYQYIKYS